MTTYPIVGAHFRPPAKAILQILPGGCPLTLTPEPTNPFDSNAIKITVATTDIPETQHEELENLAGGFGVSLEEILGKSEWHLGYVPAILAVTLAPLLAGEAAFGKLGFDLKGKPVVVL